jgi:hypothetical protein
MRRGETGTYETTSAGGERVRWFIPNPLPPIEVLMLEAYVQQRLESALLALGRLDGVSILLPDKALFLYAYVRKEAVLSSQIEGTQSPLFIIRGDVAGQTAGEGPHGCRRAGSADRPCGGTPRRQTDRQDHPRPVDAAAPGQTVSHPR